MNTTTAAANGRLIRVVGLARSGNHAIINWILRQLTGRWAFLNCIQAKTNPFLTARPDDAGRRWSASFADFDPRAECAGRHAQKQVLLLSMEDTFLRPAFGPEATQEVCHATGGAADITDVVVLRDPYNLFASRHRLNAELLPARQALRVWKQHARAHLATSPRLERPVVVANFNRWAGSRVYRAELARRLGIEFTDAGRDEIAPCAGGSSFDGFDFQDAARHMDVAARWRHYVRVSDFRAIFDRETARLARRLFPEISCEADAELDIAAASEDSDMQDHSFGRFSHS
jgi:hypothetical protein